MMRDMTKANGIEIGNGSIVVTNPGDFEVARVKGLFKKLFRAAPAITITGIFGRWDITRAGNPRPVVFVGSQYVEVDMGDMGAATGDDQRPVRLRVSEGQAVRVTFKVRP